jgi:hypothetical protein
MIKMNNIVAIAMIFTCSIMVTCNSTEKAMGTVLITDTNEIIPIQIRTSFFWNKILPWRDGRLVTSDSRHRYAEISFVSRNRAKIKPLVNFPRMEPWVLGFDTFPQAGLITSLMGVHREGAIHLAAIDDNITKTHKPMSFWWAHNTVRTRLLDPDEGLIAYQYAIDTQYLNDSQTANIGTSTYIYNYKTDNMILEIKNPVRGSIMDFPAMSFAIDNQYMLGAKWKSTETPRLRDVFFFDWRTYEIVRNDLTETMNQMGFTPWRKAINLERRYLFADIETQDYHQGEYSYLPINRFYKISWDEHYSNITVNDISYMFEGWPTKPGIISIDISPDGSWVSATIYSVSINHGGRTGYYKRMFFHVDDKYPDGISMPVFAVGYETLGIKGTAFVDHPVHGMCLALGWQEWTDLAIDRVNAIGVSSFKPQKLLGNGIILFRMEDVLTVINTRLQEGE